MYFFQKKQQICNKIIFFSFPQSYLPVILHLQLTGIVLFDADTIRNIDLNDGIKNS